MYNKGVSLFKKLGAMDALNELGILKSAAFGARTILPPGAGKLPSLYAGGLKSLKNKAVKDIPEHVADAPSPVKYYNFMGAPQATESATSRAFRGQITEEALPHLSENVMPRATAGTKPTVPAPKGPASTEAATVPPPKRPTSTEAATVPPPSKRK